MRDVLIEVMTMAPVLFENIRKSGKPDGFPLRNYI